MAMAHAVCFNTLIYANKLKESGVDSKQAEVQAELLSEIFEERLVTKEDIGILKSEVKSDISTLRSEVKSDISALRSEVRIADFRIIKD